MIICHITSVHPRSDTRVFFKQCVSIAESGEDVFLVVADGKGDELKKGVRILDVGIPSCRIGRMLSATRLVFKRARELNADLYQLHDSELLPAGLLLALSGRVVVYDAHEDVKGDLMSRSYLPLVLLRILGCCAAFMERIVASRISAVVAATPTIAGRLQAFNKRTVTIQNFPRLSELAPSPETLWESREKAIAYVGVMDLSRGMRELVTAMSLLPENEKTILYLAGVFTPLSHREIVSKLPGWERVRELGVLDRCSVAGLLGRVRAGVVVLHPSPNYVRSQPTKMYEYMSAGIPVIASNFPLWRDFFNRHRCGLVVDPMDPSAIARAVDYIMNNPDEAAAMGRRGRVAVEQGVNWELEAAKLIRLYRDLTADIRRESLGRRRGGL